MEEITESQFFRAFFAYCLQAGLDVIDVTGGRYHKVFEGCRTYLEEHDPNHALPCLIPRPITGHYFQFDRALLELGKDALIFEGAKVTGVRIPAWILKCFTEIPVPLQGVIHQAATMFCQHMRQP